MPVCSNCYGGGYSTIFEGELVGIKRLAKQMGVQPEELTGAIPPNQTPAGGFTSDAPPLQTLQAVPSIQPTEQTQKNLAFLAYSAAAKL